MKKIDYKETIYMCIQVKEAADMLNIPLENIGSEPNPILVRTLQQKLGHKSISTTMKYINTALMHMTLDLNDGR